MLKLWRSRKISQSKRQVASRRSLEARNELRKLMAKRKTPQAKEGKDPIQDLKARLEEARKGGDPEQITTVQGVVGRTLLSLGNPQEALPHLEEAYEMAMQAALMQQAARHLGNQGIARLKLGELVAALECFDKGLEQAEENGFRDMKCDALLQKT